MLFARAGWVPAGGRRSSPGCCVRRVRSWLGRCWRWGSCPALAGVVVGFGRWCSHVEARRCWSGCLLKHVGEQVCYVSSSGTGVDHLVLHCGARPRRWRAGVVNGGQRRHSDVKPIQRLPVCSIFWCFCWLIVWPGKVDTEVVAQRASTALNGVEVQVNGTVDG
jgi:hypothetical protein